MPLQDRVQAEPCAGSLSACLVDGNAEQNARERKVKRRALALSISLQTLGLTALVIAPLLAKPMQLAMRTVPPMPIYANRPSHPHRTVEARPRPVSGPCFRCAEKSRPQILHTVETTYGNTIPDGPVVFLAGAPPPGALSVSESRPAPPREVDKPAPTRIIHKTEIDPAMLTRRIEPVYPPLAKQIGRSGKVELHALIGTDGEIQSLQVVSGEEMFLKSALDAVGQWRYRPTYLNGQAVAVDTYITVVYTLRQ